MSTSFSYFVFAAAVVFLAARGVQIAVHRWTKKQDERWVRLLFVIPESFTNPFAKEHPHELKATAELYKRLQELSIPFGIEAVVHSLGEEVYFYLLVRHHDAHHAHQLVESLWPNAYLNESEEYDLWLGHNTERDPLRAGYFLERYPYSIPLKTALHGGFEPFSAILKHFSSLATVGEGVALQVLVRPAPPETTLAVGEYLKRLESGSYQASRHIHEEFMITPETLREIKEKIGSPLLRVNYRLITTASRGGAQRIFNQIAKQIEQDSADRRKQHNELVSHVPKNTHELIDAFLKARFENSQEMILSTDELATYCHLPGAHAAVAKLKHR